MDRAFDSQEKEEVRTARSNFFGLLKRKDSTPKDSRPQRSEPEDTASPFITEPDLLDFLSPNKRSKYSDMYSSNPGASEFKVPLIIRFYDPDSTPEEAQDAHGRTVDDILAWSDSHLERSHDYIQMLFPLPEGSPFNWEAPVITREVMLAFRSRSELRHKLRKSFERMLDFYGFAVSHEDEDVVEEEEEEQVPKVDSDAATTVESRAQEELGPGQTATGTQEISEDAVMGAVPELSISANEATTTDTSPTVASENAADSVPAAIEAPESSNQGTTGTLATSNSEEVTALINGYYVVRALHWRRNFRNWAVRFDHNHLRITRILRCLRVLGLQTECDAFFTALQRVFVDPEININQRSMIYWHRAVSRSLYIAPDDERIGWLKKWEEEQAKEAKKEAKKDGAKSGGKQKQSDE